MTADVFDQLRSRAATHPKRIVFTQPEAGNVLAAAEVIHWEKIARPIMLGPGESLRDAARARGISLSGIESVEADAENIDRYLHGAPDRWRSEGVGETEARHRLAEPRELALSMVRAGDADGVVSGSWPPPAVTAACFLVVGANGRTWLAVNPSAAGELSPVQLAESALTSAATCRSLLQTEPHVVFLSLTPAAALDSRDRYRSVGERLRDRIGGGVETIRARDETIRVETHPQTALEAEGKGPNVLVFTSSEAGDLAYRLGEAFQAARVLGPIAQGTRVPVNAVSTGHSIEDIVDIGAVTALMAGSEE